MDFIKKNKEYDIIGFGEVMLRLSPDSRKKSPQAKVLIKMQVAQNSMLYQAQRCLEFVLPLSPNYLKTN